MEQDRPGQETNVAPLEAQLDHTYQDPLNKANDSGMANQGQTPEFTGEKQEGNELERDTNGKPEKNEDVEEEEEEEEEEDQDPGERQKENQGDRKDDDLAA